MFVKMQLSIQISELNYRYMPLKPLSQMNWNLVGTIYNRNKNRLWRPCLLTDWDEMSNLYRGPSIDVSYQFFDHLAKRFQRRRFIEIDQSETSIACGGDCSFRPNPLTNMAATGDSCFCLADFLDSSPLKLFCQIIRSLGPCLLMDRCEMSNLYRGPSIDGSY
jgi:hypothetical protein